MKHLKISVAALALALAGSSAAFADSRQASDRTGIKLAQTASPGSMNHPWAAVAPGQKKTNEQGTTGCR